MQQLRQYATTLQAMQDKVCGFQEVVKRGGENRENKVTNLTKPEILYL